MKRIILATIVIALTGAGIGLIAATQTKEPSIKETVTRVINIKKAQNRYIMDILDKNILNTPASRTNPFTSANGELQTTNVILAYYDAAWKQHDSHQKLLLAMANQLKTTHKLITAATGLTPEQLDERIKKDKPFAASLDESLSALLKVFSIQGLAALFISIPYPIFMKLGIPAITIKPILLGTNWTSELTKKALYNNKKYKDLKPLFDLIDKRVIDDWKTWTLDHEIVQENNV